MNKTELEQLHKKAWMSYFHPSSDRELDEKNLQEYHSAVKWVFRNLPIERVELRESRTSCFLWLILDEGIEVATELIESHMKDRLFAAHSDLIGRCVSDIWRRDEIIEEVEVDIDEIIDSSKPVADWSNPREALCWPRIVIDESRYGIGRTRSQLVATRFKKQIKLDARYWHDYVPSAVNDTRRDRLWNYLLPQLKAANTIDQRSRNESELLADRPITMEVAQDD